MQLIQLIYAATKTFPKEEIFGLTSQLKRAAVSVAANIAEGMGRQYKKDAIHFLHMSRGSTYEVETLLNICRMNKIISENGFEEILQSIDATVRLLNGLIKYLEKADLR